MTDIKLAAPRIVIALDYDSVASARSLVDQLQPTQCRLKIGLELYSVAGNAFVRELVDRGFDVFLDLKFHDIPTTVARACRVAAELGVWMINIHTLGGMRMMQAAREAVSLCRNPPLLIGVTVLTSHDAGELVQVGIDYEPGVEVARLAALAKQASLDGVVCSPHEATRLRTEFGPDFRLITPGVRPEGSEQNDQQRIMTPAQALAAGADYLVIGRPVTQAENPVEALTRISESLQA